MIDEDPSKRFADALNRHGFPFQNAVIRRIGGLSDTRRTPWVLEALEFPVCIHGKDTRIDFVLSAYRSPFLVIAECKRVNPAYSDWLFVPGRTVGRRDQNELLADAITTAHSSFATTVVFKRPGDGSPLYRLALEVRNNRQRGDAAGETKQAIEEAAAQVLRGVNGLMQYLKQNPEIMHDPTSRVLLPVIFTTAQLWVTQSDLSTADLLTGQIEATSLKAKKVPYLFYQHHVSAGMKHGLPHDGGTPPVNESLSDALVYQFVRSIGVVSADGIDDFMQSIHPHNLSAMALS